MFRRGSRRNFRRRKSESSEEEEEEAAPGSQPTAARSAAARRGLACASKPAPAPSSPAEACCTSPCSASHSGNEDATAETVAALKQAGKGPGSTTVRHKHLLSFVCDREADEEEFKLKKTGNTILFEPQWKKKKQNNTEEDEVIAKVDAKDRQDFIPTKTQKGNSSEKETADIHTESEDEIISEVDESNTSGVARYKSQSGEIPDARYIKAARRKRQLARAQADFIPLHSLARDDTSVPDEELLTSDEELDDDEKRIHFTKALKTQRQKMAKEIGVNESESGSIESGGEDDDDDQLLWEQQQTKRVKVFSPHFTETVSRPNTLIVNKMLDNLKKLPPVNFETVKKRLVNRLESLQEVHHSHHREQEKIQETAESSRCTIEHLEAVSDSGIRYRFYQEMRTYVKNLVNCFNEKIHLINELEYEMHQLLQEQARKLLQRRQDDIQDESSDIWQLSNKVDIDKDGVKTKQQLMEKREARRAHREYLRKVAGKEADCHKGMSSDEEISPGDVSEFHTKEDHILKEARKIFSDVQEDFCSVDRVFAKFRLWREKFPDSYYDAYIGLCLQKIMNPLVRLQLISWNPLKQDCLHLLEMPWISALEEYCHLEDEEFKKKDKSDATLLLTVIEKTVIPKIEGFVIHVWDPLSSSQTKCLVQVFRKLKEEYNVFGSEQSKATQALKKSIVMRITLSVEEDIFIPLYPKSVLEDRTSIHSQFQERQFWSAVKLLGNILQWDGLLPDETLQDLSLDKLLNRYILLILQTSPPHSKNIEKCEKIIDCFPRCWFENLQGRRSLPQLENLCKYLLQSIRRIYENGATTQDMDNIGRESIKEMLKMLAMIHALEQTEGIINECKLEDLEWSFQGN
ncbi:intron Large complex component GCFC2-like isoform X1 [Hypanus sabinus]|uniref:intron Large complex component GCFC2-like isoform X1 n=1 Tax=Hypanus sabinus TaxID=79690 RepID=UPI0028C37D53|nr:intron Large complex component GCFC2-like isoform X1 [Hypanus sabinus]